MPKDVNKPQGGLATAEQMSRRKVLGYGSGALVASIAGCAGGDDGANGGDPAGDSDTIIGPTLRFPDELNWNQMGTGTFPNHNTANFVYSKFAVMDANNEWQPALGEEWSVPDIAEKGDEVTMRLKDGLSYHDGTELTAERLADDAIVRIKMERLPDFTDARVEDDLTISLEVSGPASGEVLENSMSGLNGRYGSDLIEDIPDRFHDAGTDDDLSEIRSELVEMTWDEPVGAGPWKYERAESDHLLLKRFEDYPYQSNIENMRQNYIDGDNIQRAVQSGTLDFMQDREGWVLDESNHPPREQEPEVRQFQANEGWSVTFDLRSDIWGNRNVRRAIAHIINRWSVVQDQLPSNATNDIREEVGENSTPPSLTLLSGEQEERFLGDSRNDYPTYGYARTQDEYEPHVNEAEGLLTGEGFTKEDEEWYTPDGDRWEASIRAGPVFVPWARSVSNQLQRFGIECVVNAMEGGSFWNAMNSEEEFDMTMALWGPSRVHPYNNYNRLNGAAGFAQAESVFGVDHDGEQHIEVEVPMPIGNPDGSMETVDITELINDLQRVSENEASDIVRTLSWVHSQFVMMIPLNIVINLQLITNDEWAWPEEGSAMDWGLDGFYGAVPWLFGEVNGK